MSDGKGASLFGRVALLLLTVYALAMIVPDLLRVVRPLGSFGLAMDGDGRIYDVQGPFEASTIRQPGEQACAREIGSILPRCRARPSTPSSARVCCRNGAASPMSRQDARRRSWSRRGQTTRGAKSSSPPSRAHESPAGRRRCARHDRRDPGCARRGLAGVDASRPHDLGFLHLRDPVQPRPGVSVLGLAPALAAGASGAERHFPRDAGRRLYRAPLVRAEGAGRPGRRAMADDRARAAGSGDRVLGRGARQHGDRLRLSGRNLGESHAVDRLCGQRRRARDPDRTPAGPLASRLSAHPLGDLGLPDRPSGLSARPAFAGNLAVRPIPRRGSGPGGSQPARSSSSTGSCACSSSRRCGGGPWSTSGSRFAGRPPSAFCSACRFFSSTSRSR